MSAWADAVAVHMLPDFSNVDPIRCPRHQRTARARQHRPNAMPTLPHGPYRADPMYTNATGAPPVSDKSDACVTPMLLVGCFQTVSPCDANAAGMPHATTTQNQRSVDRLLHPEYADRLRRRSHVMLASPAS
ncbi:uncharacterized protein KRP23_8325 [Phytophthora ramorum]|uniref:uncharacterized protein n=1 Tax=Phytophthora ramorum TaxID=164328 RepID=UPI0030997AD1|nr:hypothetical protein KRP23_8325 [Phytophthora ramorum]